MSNNNNNNNTPNTINNRNYHQKYTNASSQFQLQQQHANYLPPIATSSFKPNFTSNNYNNNIAPYSGHSPLSQVSNQFAGQNTGNNANMQALFGARVLQAAPQRMILSPSSPSINNINSFQNVHVNNHGNNNIIINDGRSQTYSNNNNNTINNHNINNKNMNRTHQKNQNIVKKDKKSSGKHSKRSKRRPKAPAPVMQGLRKLADSLTFQKAQVVKTVAKHPIHDQSQTMEYSHSNSQSGGNDNNHYSNNQYNSQYLNNFSIKNSYNNPNNKFGGANIDISNKNSFSNNIKNNNNNNNYSEKMNQSGAQTPPTFSKQYSNQELSISSQIGPPLELMGSLSSVPINMKDESKKEPIYFNTKIEEIKSPLYYNQNSKSDDIIVSRFPHARPVAGTEYFQELAGIRDGLSVVIPFFNEAATELEITLKTLYHSYQYLCYKSYEWRNKPFNVCIIQDGMY